MAGGVENLKPWKPGQSGNPNGRPVKRPITEGYEKVLDLPLPDDVRTRLKMPKGATYKDALALRQVLQAISGKTEAAREIADRVEGKVKHRIELTGADGGPMRIKGEASRPLRDWSLEELEKVRAELAKVVDPAALPPPTAQAPTSGAAEPT